MDLVENESNDVIDEQMEITSNETNPDDSKAMTKNDFQTATQMINSPKIKKLCSPYDPEYFLRGFILFIGLHEEFKYNIIRESCHFSVLTKPFYKIEKFDSVYFSDLYIENQYITTGEGTSIKKSQIDASIKAFDILKEKCFIVMVKEADEIVFRNNLSSGITIRSTHLPSPKTLSYDNNVDGGLQTMMGLKKDSELENKEMGHEKSIVAVNFQQNLKLSAGTTDIGGKYYEQKINSAMQLAIKECINLFLEGPKTRLVFSSEFSKEERTFIHLICGDLGLKSKSYRHVFNRHIVVKKRQSARDIFNDLINNGYENDQFILFPPKE